MHDIPAKRYARTCVSLRPKNRELRQIYAARLAGTSTPDRSKVFMKMFPLSSLAFSESAK